LKKVNDTFSSKVHVNSKSSGRKRRNSKKKYEEELEVVSPVELVRSQGKSRAKTPSSIRCVSPLQLI
jgi:hypothetical protein